MGTKEGDGFTTPKNTLVNPTSETVQSHTFYKTAKRAQIERLLSKNEKKKTMTKLLTLFVKWRHLTSLLMVAERRLQLFI